jgi:hypothetical protein
LQIWNALQLPFKWQLNTPSRRIGLLAVIGFLSIAVMLAVARGVTWRDMVLPPALFAAAFAASWLPQIVAWGAMHTNSDTVLNMICVLLFLALVVGRVAVSATVYAVNCPVVNRGLADLRAWAARRLPAWWPAIAARLEYPAGNRSPEPPGKISALSFAGRATEDSGKIHDVALIAPEDRIVATAPVAGGMLGRQRIEYPGGCRITLFGQPLEPAEIERDGHLATRCRLSSKVWGR